MVAVVDQVRSYRVEHGTLPDAAEMSARAIEQTELWNTPFGDVVPEVFASVLGQPIVVVQRDQPEYRIGPVTGGSPLYVLRTGPQESSHYMALELRGQAPASGAYRAAVPAGRLDSRLSALGLVRLEDIDRDGDCYYRSWRRAMVAFGGEDYLRETVYGGRDPSVDVPREDSPDELVWAGAVENYSIELMRRWLASRLEADFRAANQGLPSRYAAAFHYVDGVDPAVQQQQWLHYIRTPGEWDADIGEAVMQVTAGELRLPMLVVRDSYEYPLGPVPDGVVFGARGQGRLPLILEPNHYEFGGWTDQDVETIPWKRLEPLPASSVEAAREASARDLDAAGQRYAAAVEGYRRVREDLAAEARDRYDDRLAQLTADRQDALGPGLWQHLPAPVRAGRTGPAGPAGQRRRAAGRRSRAVRRARRCPASPATRRQQRPAASARRGPGPGHHGRPGAGPGASIQPVSPIRPVKAAPDAARVDKKVSALRRLAVREQWIKFEKGDEGKPAVLFVDTHGIDVYLDGEYRRSVKSELNAATVARLRAAYRPAGPSRPAPPSRWRTRTPPGTTWSPTTARSRSDPATADLPEARRIVGGAYLPGPAGSGTDIPGRRCARTLAI